MVFASLVFLYLYFPLFLILYFGVKSVGWKNGVIVVFSLFFYGWGEPLWISLLLFATTFDYGVARLIEKWRGTPKSKIALIISLISNLGILALFKYSPLVVHTVNDVAGTSFAVPGFTLPNRYVTRITIGRTAATVNTVYVTFGGFNGDNVWRSLDGGTIGVHGKVGRYAGFGMKRGTILLSKQDNLHATLHATMQDCGAHNLPFLKLLFNAIKPLKSKFSALDSIRVQRYGGDIANDGTGEILMLEK